MYSPHAKPLPLPSVPSSTPPGVSGTKSPVLLTGRFQMDVVIVTSPNWFANPLFVAKLATWLAPPRVSALFGTGRFYI